MSREGDDAALLGGRYEIGEVIGRGGMADVHRGRDVRLGRAVAVKLLRADLALDPAFQSRFRREAQAAASLDAPAVVAVYDTGEDGRGVPWIVMELVDGRTLREVLHTEGRLLPERALDVAADVCSALDAAHAAGMVHRDIKPGNVMLTTRGEVKVMDFGIARAAASSSSTLTQTAVVIGTAAYLSPEQARGEHVDARSDLYSTGCLLYELVTGAPPFVGDSPVAVAYQHVREDPVPPSAYDPTLAPQVDAVILKAMAKNPANRYQSAQEMRDDLLRAGAGEAVLATPVMTADEPVRSSVVVATARDSTGDRADRPARGHRAYWLLALGMLLLALLVALLVRQVLGSPTAGDIKPPAVVGLQQSTATAQLAAADLRVDHVKAVFNAAPAGTVLSQSPDQHFFVTPGGSVDLVVSQGLQRSAVPAVLGLSETDAAAELKAARLKQVSASRNGPYVAGVVLEVTPTAGTVVPAGTSVTVVLATGLVDVPEVRGKQQDAAVAQLRQLGFSVALREAPSASRPGTVLTETSAGGAAPVGSTILLDVAAAALPAPAATPAPTAPSPGPTP